MKTENGNYSVTVHYIKNGLDKKVDYIVNNFDKTPPEIQNITQTGIKDPASETVNAYISFLEPIDNLSGVKVLKFAKENITEGSAKTYFENSGNIILNNKIKIQNYPIYTIYIEDLAGNYNIYSVNIEENILSEFN